MEDEVARRETRPRERSHSYSAAIGNSFGNCSVRSSIEIPSIVNTEVYNNEELKNRYRISQTYVEGKEIEFPLAVHNLNREDLKINDDIFSTDYMYTSSEDTDDEHACNGIVMKIDIENNNGSTNQSNNSTYVHNISNNSTIPIVSSSGRNEDYDSIEVEENIYNTIPERPASTVHGHSSIYTKRIKSNKNRLVLFISILLLLQPVSVHCWT